MNAREILQPMFQDMGLARPNTQHVLMVQEEDGSLVRWNTAPGTTAWLESLTTQASKMHCPAWVQSEELPNG